MSNPHIENAIHTIGEANTPGLGWETADAQHIALHIEANTRATLALAYAQDTANLLEAWRLGMVENIAIITERLNLA